MKRKTREWLESWSEHSAFYAEFDDILDSDARQTATIRRLRKALKTLATTTEMDVWEMADVAAAALRPARKTGKR